MNDPHYVTKCEGNTYKNILPGVDIASRYKVAGTLRTKKVSEVAFVMEVISKKGNVSKYFKVFAIMRLSLKVMWHSCSKNILLPFEEPQQNAVILTVFVEVYQPGEQHGDKKDGLLTLSGLKIQTGFLLFTKWIRQDSCT